MAISEPFENSATIGTTEWSLTTNTAGPAVETSDGIFQCWLDLNALALGDIFEWRLYEKVRSSGTQRETLCETLVGPSKNWMSVAPVLMNGWDMTLKKLSGTDRSIGWSIRKIA